MTFHQTVQRWRISGLTEKLCAASEFPNYSHREGSTSLVMCGVAGIAFPSFNGTKWPPPALLRGRWLSAGSTWGSRETMRFQCGVKGKFRI